MGRGRNPVGLGAAGRRGRTLGAVTAIQFCWRERDPFTKLAGADGDLNDGVADLRGGLSLREHVLGGTGQGDVQQRRDVGWREPSAGTLRGGKGCRGAVLEVSLGQLRQGENRRTLETVRHWLLSRPRGDTDEGLPGALHSGDRVFTLVGSGWVLTWDSSCHLV